MRDVFVTGIGMVTPLGRTCEETWRHLLEGRTAIRRSIGGLEAVVDHFSVNGAGSRMGEFAVAAAADALVSAGLAKEDLKNCTVGCAVSQSKPVIEPITLFGKSINPALLFSQFTGMSANTLIQERWNLTGPASNLVAACATGVASLNEGANWVATGECELALAGASESSLTPLYEAGFRQMGVLSDSISPSSIKPFDHSRSGFVMGEGAGVFLLESADSIKKRNVQPICLFKRSLLRHSAWDAVRFDPSGVAVADLLTGLTQGVKPPLYINAHGTGTELNDRVESEGILMALAFNSSHVMVSSTKAATGHLLGAAGAVEAAFAALAVRDQIVPPTLHLENPISSLDYVPHVARQAEFNHACSLSYGFGGQMGGVLFERTV